MIILPSEQSSVPLSLAQVEGLFTSFYRVTQSLTIASDTLTVPGSGRYTILPQSGTSDTISSIVLSAENVTGALIQLQPQTVGHTITLVHAGNLHLAGGVNAELSTIYSFLWMRHMGSGVWRSETPVIYVP